MTHTVAAHVHEADPPRFVETWTEEQVALLRLFHSQGWRRGAMADEINRRTGSKFTRSAVCGKIDRLYPAAKPIKTEEEKATTKAAREARYNEARRERRAQQRATFKPRLAPAPVVLTVVQPDPNDHPEARVHGIDALERSHCRFECSGDDFNPATPVFCGLPILASSKFSYCAGHHRLCVTPLKVAGSAAA